VSAASHHELLLQRPETLLQTRLPTVRARSFIPLHVELVSSSGARCFGASRYQFARARVCVYIKGNI